MSDFPALPCPTTREAALAAARDFAPHMGIEYAQNRNYVMAGHPNVSKLGAAVKVRLLTEAELAQIAIKEHGNLPSCQKFVQQIHWRSYWRSWLELRPQVWRDYQLNRENARRSLDQITKKRLEATENGESGVAPLDAFARELIETGYLHNHARMWFAAFWIHEQNLPWELGADFFERHLACACPASNTLSWRWVAGLHTPGKSYLTRRSNLEKYCDESYLDARRGMERLENPRPATLLVDEVPPPQMPPFHNRIPTDKQPTGIWISEDDLSPETSVLAAFEPCAVTLSHLKMPDAEKSNGIGVAFRRAAVNDAVTRATRAWNAPTSVIEASQPAHLALQLEKWAVDKGLRRVVALKPFVGPNGDALPELQKSLQKVGIELHLLRRAEDARLLPHARAGFFRFWSAFEPSEQ